MSFKHIRGIACFFYQINDIIQVVNTIRWGFTTYCICNIFACHLLCKFKKSIVSKFSSILPKLQESNLLKAYTH